MAKGDEGEILRKGQKVILTKDLREVPAGTQGRIVLSVGLSWIRYWVQFANGVAVGSVNRRHLATPEEWRRLQERGDEPEAAEDTADDDDDGAGAGGGDGYTHAGVVVPQFLLDRSKAARERLGA